MTTFAFVKLGFGVAGRVEKNLARRAIQRNKSLYIPKCSSSRFLFDAVDKSCRKSMKDAVTLPLWSVVIGLGPPAELGKASR